MPCLEEKYERLSREYFLARRHLTPITKGIWSYNGPPERDYPTQGWKLHISATILNATTVIRRVRRVLRDADVVFKCATNLDALLQINTGFEYTQTGKFMTIYARTADQAVDLASRLHACTHDLCGPNVPFDAHYLKDGIVSYRYGSFIRKNGKEGSDKIVDPTGKLCLDRRDRPVPSWTRDPFKEHRSVPSRKGLVERGYVVFRALSQRGKGGVYEALDLRGSLGQICIIKQGRKYGEVYWDSSDGVSRIKREAVVLKALRLAGMNVPKIYETFYQRGDYYLVMEKLKGRALLRTAKTEVSKPSWRRAYRIYKMVSELLDGVHATGWAWRDCKPDNLIWENGKLRPLDFEGACPLTQTDVPPWGAPQYTPRGIYRSLRRPRGTAEDDYALGVISFQFGVGYLPPKSDRKRRKLLRQTHCPPKFRRRILELLNS